VVQRQYFCHIFGRGLVRSLAVKFGFPEVSFSAYRLIPGHYLQTGSFLIIAVSVDHIRMQEDIPFTAFLDFVHLLVFQIQNKAFITGSVFFFW
jgi:hypothetical protein